MTERYFIVRQIKKMPHCVPGKNLDYISFDLRQAQADTQRSLQKETFKRNESIAKTLIDNLSPDTTFTIKRRCDEEPCGETTHQVNIIHRTEKQVEYTLSGSKKTEKSNYLGFCLQTGLMIRDLEGKPIENHALTQTFKDQTADIPQIRSAA